MDFAINAGEGFRFLGSRWKPGTENHTVTVQAVDRALLVDTLPPSCQVSGNAWAASMSGVGSVVFSCSRSLIAFIVFLFDLFEKWQH